jgi:hypothetical protein
MKVFFLIFYQFLRNNQCFSIEELEAAGSGSNLGLNYSHLDKTGQGIVDGGCDLRMNCSTIQSLLYFIVIYCENST